MKIIFMKISCFVPLIPDSILLCYFVVDVFVSPVIVTVSLLAVVRLDFMFNEFNMLMQDYSIYF